MMRMPITLYAAPFAGVCWAPELALVKEAAMTHAKDSQRPRRTRRQFTAAALVLLASVGWAQQVSDQVTRHLSDTPTTVYAGTLSGVLRSLDGGDSWSDSSPTSSMLALVIDPLANHPMRASRGRRHPPESEQQQLGGNRLTIPLSTPGDRSNTDDHLRGEWRVVFRASTGQTWARTGGGWYAVPRAGDRPEHTDHLYAAGEGAAEPGWGRQLREPAQISGLADPITPTTLYVIGDGGAFKSERGTAGVRSTTA
jgi:hypothetical protein